MTTREAGVNPRSLQTVLRSLAAAEPPAADGELLRRFVGGDDAAFAELVRRHGRLVWAVCRHLTGSDAEADDAFQATFLVLLRNAPKVRDPGRLSAWLHGVAYKVCGSARRAAHRRAARERVAAAPERNGSAVPDSAWDRALAAVHEEAGRLPDALRVPFVLCCLEGKGVTEAAEQLGWKLGTLSGRLTRAKAAILARLDARGLTLGAVAGLGLAAPPADAMAKAAALARAGAAIPNAILQLSQGVIGMTATPFKLLAAAVLVGGLGLGLGTGWAPTADAQIPAKPSPPKPDPQAEAKRLAAELEKAQRAAQEAQRPDYKAEQEAAEEQLRSIERLRWAERMAEKGYVSDAVLLALKQKEKPSAPAAATAKWEYDFVKANDTTLAKFVEFLRDREAAGWEFVGTTRINPVFEGGSQGAPVNMWVLRRPVKALNFTSQAPATRADVTIFNRDTGAATGTIPRAGADSFKRGTGPATGTVPSPGVDFTKPGTGPGVKLALPPDDDVVRPTQLAKGDDGKAKADDAAAIEAEIARLQQKLAALKGRGREQVTTEIKGTLPLGPPELGDMLTKLAAKKFPGRRIAVQSDGTGGFRVQGEKEVVDWAVALIRKLNSDD